MASAGLLGWVATWNGESVLHWTLSVGTFLAVLRREARESWEPWRRKRWCRARRKWGLANPGKPWPVPEDYREWARWGHEKKMFGLSEYTNGVMEILGPGTAEYPHAVGCRAPPAFGTLNGEVA